jgi:hypothetical protein
MSEEVHPWGSPVHTICGLPAGAATTTLKVVVWVTSMAFGDDVGVEIVGSL